jgi:4-hydroxybutyryl-CoA dehydratase/vinylacetyl-CoA-Delta-isomerase
MALRTAKQYIESLRDGRVVYLSGNRVEDVTENPFLRIAIDLCAMDYTLINDPRHQSLMVENDGEGEPSSFVFMPERSAEDLSRRREIIQLGARVAYGKGTPAKFTGIDGLNTVTVVCRRMDKKLGTNYSEHVEDFRRHLQKSDSSVALAMTDVKGDRSLRPSQQQTHKDYYLRIVDERSDGIVVRGAKAHISLAAVVNEMVILPTRAMREDDRDYAVAFAIPPNTKGITMICPEPEIKEVGDFFENPICASAYLTDCLVVFDDVFIPMERVFMKGEWQLSGDMAYTFGNFHRLSADAYKSIELELLVGAAALMAEYNGLERAPHIQDKLTWLAMYIEGTEVLGRAACEHCVKEPGTDLVYPNPIYSNISKFFFADNYHQAIKYLQDIAGGIVATAPSSKDFLNPETRPLIEKYLGGKDGIPAEHRLRLVKLIKDLTSSYEGVLTLHAEGSLAAQRLSIHVLADFERYKAAAKRAARIKDGTEHPLYSQLPDFPPTSLA